MSGEERDTRRVSPSRRSGWSLPLPPAFLAVLAVGIAARLVLMAATSPGSDVYYYDRQAVQAILAGATPYNSAVPQVPPGLGTPGAEGFQYLPLTALFLVPFYAVGDLRLGFVFADIIVSVSLYMLGKRWGLALGAVYLLLPVTWVFSVYFLNDALVGMAFVSLFLLFEENGRPLLGSVSLGAALASTQFAFLVLPFAAYYLLRKRPAKHFLISLAVAGAIAAPFLLADLPKFVSETVTFQFSRTAYPLFSTAGPWGFNFNPSLDGFATSFAGAEVPASIRGALLLLPIPLFLRKVRTLLDVALSGAVFVSLSIFILPNNIFWSYFELPFVLFLAWAAFASRPPAKP